MLKKLRFKKFLSGIVFCTTTNKVVYNKINILNAINKCEEEEHRGILVLLQYMWEKPRLLLNINSI